MRLQKRGAVGTRIDVNQWIALLYALTLLKLHVNHQAIHLAGNRSGIYRSDRADGVQIDADVALGSRGSRNGDPDHLGSSRGRRRFLCCLVVAPDQHQRQQQEQRQQDPENHSQALAPGTRRNRSCRELMVAADVPRLFWSSILPSGFRVEIPPPTLRQFRSSVLCGLVARRRPTRRFEFCHASESRIDPPLHGSDHWQSYGQIWSTVSPGREQLSPRAGLATWYEGCLFE